METEMVREFIMLSQEGNYLAAAEELFISQPTLTKHIKALEAQLGVQLFDRSTRRVTLSKFGKAFLPYAERMLEAERAARQELSRLLQSDRNALNLGVIPSFVTYNIMDYLTRFKSRFPEDSITLREGSNEDLLRWLLDGQCNMAIVRHFDEKPDPRFVCLPLVRDRLAVVVPFGHPFDDGRAWVSVEDLQGQKLLMSTNNTAEKTLRRLCEGSGVKLDVTTHLGLGRPELIVGMLKQGFGPALLMKHAAVHTYEGRLRILDLRPEISTTVSLVYDKKTPLNDATRHFLGIVFPDAKS